MSSGSEDGDNLHGAQVSKVLRLNKGEDGIDERSKKDVCCDLLILGLPYSLEEDELKEYFERYGAVSFVEVRYCYDLIGLFGVLWYFTLYFR